MQGGGEEDHTAAVVGNSVDDCTGKINVARESEKAMRMKGGGCDVGQEPTTSHRDRCLHLQNLMQRQPRAFVHRYWSLSENATREIARLSGVLRILQYL